MNEIIQSGFDYAALPVESVDRLKTWKTEIAAFTDTVESSLVQIGLRFQKAQAELNRQGVKGEGFAIWVKNETTYSLSTAYKLINVATEFEDKPLVNFTRGVLYAVCAPTTPQEVKDKAFEKGEETTLADVKDWKADYEAERKAREQAEQRVEDAVAEWKQRSKDWHSQYIGERDKRKQVEFELSAASRRQAEIQTPADYDALKQTERDLRNELADLKQQQRELVQQQVVAKLAERQREINDLEKKTSAAQQQLDALQRQIGAYTSQERELEVHLDENERTRVALARLAANMAGWDEMASPDAELLKWRALADMMEQGAAAIRRFIGDAKPSLTVIRGEAA